MDEMLSQFKDMTELTEYAAAQYQTILELSRKLQALTEERDHLKTILEGSMPLLESEKSGLSGLAGIPNEQIIAETQLFLLRQESQSRQLTLEECKKTEVYAKILSNLKSAGDGKKPADIEVKQLTNADLLQQLKGLESK